MPARRGDKKESIVNPASYHQPAQQTTHHPTKPNASTSDKLYSVNLAHYAENVGEH
jgi:hypothetical protein